MNLSFEKDIDNKQTQNVHCLVHPGFDEGEHIEFESHIHKYIEDIALKTNDILLIVSDGEIFDNEQLQQFAHLDTLRVISLYVSLQTGGIADLIEIYNNDGNFNQGLQLQGLTEGFYKWCKNNINLSELELIADEYRKLQNSFFAGEYSGNRESHDIQIKTLNEREYNLRANLDLQDLLKEAIKDFGPAFTRSRTSRNISNKGRFFRILQHANQVLGKDRLKEIFIADGEHPEILPINPVSHFQTYGGDIISTPLGYNAQIYNASEQIEYGNAAALNDKITYQLSLSRHNKLAEQQPKKILDHMGVEITSDTIFSFAGEYRKRCVDNVANILKHRLSIVPPQNFIIASDNLTLERPY